MEALGVFETEPDKVVAATATFERMDNIVEDMEEVTLARVTEA
jgi:hypothetical protein